MLGGLRQQRRAGGQHAGCGLDAGHLDDRAFLVEQERGGEPLALGGGDRHQVGAGREPFQEPAGLGGVQQAGGGLVGGLGERGLVEGGVLAGEPVRAKQPHPHQRLSFDQRHGSSPPAVTVWGGERQTVAVENGAVGGPVRRPAGVDLGSAAAGC